MSASLLNAPISLYTIPTAWLLAHVPQVLKVNLLAKSKSFNNLQPRQNVQKFSSKEGVEAQLKAKISRAEAAHFNGLESYPLWSIAVLAANFAGLDQSFINKTALVYLSARVAFNYIYLNQSKAWHGLGRTFVWVVGVVAPMTLLVKAANVVASK